MNSNFQEEDQWKMCAYQVFDCIPSAWGPVAQLDHLQKESEISSAQESVFVLVMFACSWNGNIFILSQSPVPTWWSLAGESVMAYIYTTAAETVKPRSKRGNRGFIRYFIHHVYRCLISFNSISSSLLFQMDILKANESFNLEYEFYVRFSHPFYFYFRLSEWNQYMTYSCIIFSSFTSNIKRLQVLPSVSGPKLQRKIGNTKGILLESKQFVLSFYAMRFLRLWNF